MELWFVLLFASDDNPVFTLHLQNNTVFRDIANRLWVLV